MGIVAHFFATPIPAVWDMELVEVLAWAAEAAELAKRRAR